MADSSHHDRRSRRDSTPVRWRLGERPLQVGYVLLWVLVFTIAGVFSAGTGFSFLVRDVQPPVVDPSALAPAGDPPASPTQRGLKVPAKVIGERIGVWEDGQFATPFLAGVNLGAAVPGHEPGAVAATRVDYDRWFDGMRALGVQVVRIYTILPPAFYQALRDHNLRHPRAPIRLLQGVWIPEERWYATRDIFDPALMREMRRELSHVVGAVHGTATIPTEPGHASGVYTADVSPWLVGWSFGIEWDPTTVIATNRANAGTTAGDDGLYIRATADASPMERWLALQLDTLAGLEVARGISVPLTFTNWDTTDPLRHPDEPFDLEDAVSIDALHLRPTSSWPGGYFASFHAYPYYPDFQAYEPALLRYRRPDGLVDPYAGYINRLRRHFRGMPLMITEVGQPTAFGCAHRATLGRDQGCQSERGAAANLVSMMDAIHQEGAVGAIAFMWIDEWFKFTWNTIDYELPGNRRSLWRSPLTNEEHFGFIAAEPGPHDEVVLDGRDADWADKQVIATARGPVSEVRATHDAENLYLRLKLTPGLWMRRPIVIGLDAHRAGNRGLPGMPGVDTAADVAFVIGPGRTARVFHAAWLDAIGMRFGGHANPERRYVDVDRADLEQGSGAWQPFRQLLGHPLTVPTTRRKIPPDIRDASRLLWGPTDAASPDFDDRNMVDAHGDVLEIAIPWGMSTFADPSSHRVYEFRLVADAKRQVVTRPIEHLGISVAVGDRLLRTDGYEWERWDTVTWHERRKAGWPTLRRAYAGYRVAAQTGSAGLSPSR